MFIFAFRPTLILDAMHLIFYNTVKLVVLVIRLILYVIFSNNHWPEREMQTELRLIWTRFKFCRSSIVFIQKTRVKMIQQHSNLVRCASISWIHVGEWLSESFINVFEILSNLGHIFRVCSGCVQSVFRVCSGCVQSVFRVCSGYDQSMLRVCLEYVQGWLSRLVVKIGCQDWLSRL